MKTNFTHRTSNDVLLDGTEVWPILGNIIDMPTYKHIMQHCVGLTRQWHCLEKAMMVKRVVPNCNVIIGKCLVWSGDGTSNYGHEFNPPYEFHAWCQHPDGIIDIALPGLIEKGLTTSDEYGPFLVGRKPVILAGKEPQWAHYVPHEVYG